jgi:hypothetical protein
VSNAGVMQVSVPTLDTICKAKCPTMFSNSSRKEARARAYTDYVQSALHHPQFVGCHWFQYRDEPVIGRVYDEENYQIGFVDVADTPYAETISAARAVGYHLYK